MSSHPPYCTCGGPLPSHVALAASSQTPANRRLGKEKIEGRMEEVGVEGGKGREDGE